MLFRHDPHAPPGIARPEYVPVVRAGQEDSPLPLGGRGGGGLAQAGQGRGAGAGAGAAGSPPAAVRSAHDDDDQGNEPGLILPAPASAHARQERGGRQAQRAQGDQEPAQGRASFAELVSIELQNSAAGAHLHHALMELLPLAAGGALVEQLQVDGLPAGRQDAAAGTGNAQRQPLLAPAATGACAAGGGGKRQWRRGARGELREPPDYMGESPPKRLRAVSCGSMGVQADVYHLRRCVSKYMEACVRLPNERQAVVPCRLGPS